MRMIDKPKNTSGFTLLELSFVIIIVGIMMVPLFQAYERYHAQRKLDLTFKNVSAATSLIVEYTNTINQTYPCPSYRDLPIDHADYGTSPDCNALPSDVDQPGECYRGVCIIDTGLDKDGLPGTDWIIVGGYPKELIEIEASKASSTLEIRSTDYFSTRVDLDGWNNQLTYAVSFIYTQTPPLPSDPAYIENFWMGVVNAEDEHGEPTAGIGDSAHFALISHGPNGIGAFNADGIQAKPCGTTTVEDDNCQTDDATFVSALGFYRGNTTSAIDDIVRFHTITNQSIWELESDDDTGERDQIYFAPSGNLSIAMDDTTIPAFALDINGELKANNNVLVDEICDSGGLCFDTALITNTTTNTSLNTCPSGQIMRGIENNQVDCVTPAFAPSGKCEREFGGGPDDGDPTNNEKGFIQGFRGTGDVICYYK